MSFFLAASSFTECSGVGKYSLPLHVAVISYLEELQCFSGTPLVSLWTIAYRTQGWMSTTITQFCFPNTDRCGHKYNELYMEDRALGIHICTCSRKDRNPLRTEEVASPAFQCGNSSNDFTIIQDHGGMKCRSHNVKFMSTKHYQQLWKGFPDITMWMAVVLRKDHSWLPQFPLPSLLQLKYKI